MTLSTQPQILPIRWPDFPHVYQNATKKSREGLRRRASRDFQFLGGYQVATSITFSSSNGPVSRIFFALQGADRLPYGGSVR